MSERGMGVAGGPGDKAGEIPAEKPDPGARPIRLRGMYRAAKRGEEWAVKITSMPEGFSKMLAIYFRRTDFKKELARPSLLDQLPKDDSWTGCYLPIPLRS